MRRIAVFIACVVLIVFALADQASARRGWGFHGGGFRGRGFRGGGLRGFRDGVWRGGRGFAWRGGRGWRGRGRGWGFWPWGIAAGLAAAPYYYRSYYSDCPLVRQRVVTRYGYRTRLVRACNSYSYW